MKLKIISDGIPKNTRVLTEDGVEIDNIQSITWHCGVDELATVTLKLVLTEAEIMGKLHSGEYKTVITTPIGETYEHAILVKKGAI